MSMVFSGAAAGVPRALLFGATGQVGECLLRRLLDRGWSVTACSRAAQPVRAGVVWCQADLAQAGWMGDFDAIFSTGPLDHFAAWYARGGGCTPRVVAFGSTSVEVKRHSRDAGERDVAQRLADAEQRVLEIAQTRGAAATVLRPALIYGAARDRTLTRIAALAQRTGMFVLPGNATGLRQPVHVDDLADAAVAVLARPNTYQRHYMVAGGEVLMYRQMVERVLQVLPRPARLYTVPSAMFALALALSHRVGWLRGLSVSALQRMREDLVFDLQPAREDFAYAPRSFRPSAAELGIGAG